MTWKTAWRPIRCRLPATLNTSFLFVLAVFFSVLVRDAVTFSSALSGQCAEHPARDCGTLGV